MWNLLSLNDFKIDKLKNIKGIAYRENGKININPPENIVPQDRMDIDLPGYAWDLLPMDKKPTRPL